MTYPAELHNMVDELALASKKLASHQEEAAKIPQAQEKVARLRDKLVKILDSHGLPEEAVDLLLAAR